MPVDEAVDVNAVLVESVTIVEVVDEDAASYESVMMTLGLIPLTAMLGEADVCDGVETRASAAK